MGLEQTAAGLTANLARRHRVLMLGGLAVIGHGLSRSTYDSDVWLDPGLPVGEWCSSTSGLAVTDLTVSAGTLSIGWSAVPGKSYLVESNVSLTGNNPWIPAGPVLVAPPGVSSLSTNFPVGGGGAFFRVRLNSAP